MNNTEKHMLIDEILVIEACIMLVFYSEDLTINFIWFASLFIAYLYKRKNPLNITIKEIEIKIEKENK